jgi:hypothetical protein
MTFPTPHIGHSRHGFIFYKTEPSEKDHDDLPEIRTRDLGLAVSIANHYTI